MSPAAAAESPTATGEVDTERPQETANENTALLSNNNNDYEDGRLKRDLDAITAEDVGAEIIHLVQMSWPVSLGYILTQVLGLTSLFFIGQYIDTQHLAAVALATMFA